ncbi:MAG TPA: right-handed parallel beta-helix repeat-containing protein [Candidatus Eisenbacteria bacterium]
MSPRDDNTTLRRFRPLRLALLLLAITAGFGGCGGDDDPVGPTPEGYRTWHTTPDGTGSDCGMPQECLDAAAAGDTIEFAAGGYDTPADTLVDDGMGGVVSAILSARRSQVLRAAPGADVRVNGMWRPGSLGLHVRAGDDTVVVRGIRFDNCDAGLRAAGGTVMIEECEFVSGQHGIVADDAELDIRNSLFMEYAAEAMVLRNCTGRMTRSQFWGNTYGPYLAESRDFTLEHTLIALCCLTGIRIEEGGVVRLRNVTVTGVGMVPDDSTGVVVAGGAHAVIERSVIAHNRGFGIDCRTGGSAEVRCSDVVQHSSGNYHGCPDVTGTMGNLSVDPGFCGPDDLDFHFKADSPARLASCGGMGAFVDEPCGPFNRPPWRRWPDLSVARPGRD